MFVYQCPKCEREYDFEERGEYVCDGDGEKLSRVYGFGGVIFKGGGFHRTDSRNKSE